MLFPHVKLSGDLVGTARLEVEQHYLRLDKPGPSDEAASAAATAAFLSWFGWSLYKVYTDFDGISMLLVFVLLVPLFLFIDWIGKRRRFTLLIAPDREPVDFCAHLTPAQSLRIYRDPRTAKRVFAWCNTDEIQVRFPETDGHLRCWEMFSGVTSPAERGRSEAVNALGFPRVELSGGLVGAASLAVEPQYLRLDKPGRPGWVMVTATLFVVMLSSWWAMARNDHYPFFCDFLALSLILAAFTRNAAWTVCAIVVVAVGVLAAAWAYLPSHGAIFGTMVFNFQVLFASFLARRWKERRFSVLIAPGTQRVDYRARLDRKGLLRIDHDPRALHDGFVWCGVGEIQVRFNDADGHLRCWEVFTATPSALETGITDHVAHSHVHCH